MGLPLMKMNNLHAPTIPSGPTSAGANGVKTAGLTLPELQIKKENMEAELRALSGVLDSVSVPCREHTVRCANRFSTESTCQLP